MTSNLDGEGIGDGFPGTILVLDPSGKGQRHPDWPAIDQELDVDRIGVSRRDGHDQRLKNAVYFPSRPTVERMKVLEHYDSIAEHEGSEQTPGRKCPGRA